MTELSELKQKVEETITDISVPLWFPNLTGDLVKFGWEELYKDRGIKLETYSTNHLLLPETDSPREIIAKFSKDDESIDENAVILLEMLAPEVCGIYKKQGAEFYTSSEILDSPVMEILKEAFSVLRQVPSLNNSVFNLVRSIHLIKSDEAGEYDISFSEPHIPFSIFVSVPPKRVFADFLRVAEAIVHEAMHLQLTLIENVVSLTFESNKSYYSPWKSKHRKVSGILQALYVFQSLNCFFEILIEYHTLSSNYLTHLHERRQIISKQINDINEFSKCSDLTSIGRSLVKKLFNPLHFEDSPISPNA